MPSVFAYVSQVNPILNDLNISGFVLERRHWQHGHGRRSTCPKHPFGRQFLGFSAQEALAKREIFVHQEHHGTCSTFVLSFNKEPLVSPIFIHLTR